MSGNKAFDRSATAVGSVLRCGVAAGLVGPPLFGGMLAALTIVKFEFLRGLGWHPLYAPTFDWPSGLALGPHGWLMTATFLVSGALMGLFAVRLRADLIPAAVQLRRNPGAAAAGTALLALAGVALMGIAFTTDPTLRSTPATWHGRLHDGAFVLLGLSLLPAMLLLGRAFLQDPRWRTLAVYTWLTAASVVPAFVMKGAVFYVFLGAVLTWSEAVAWRLRRLAG